VAEEKLRGLETVGERLVSGLFDDTAAGKADPGSRFGQDDVGLDRERRGDAPEAGVGEDGDVG
jgi:hypothetical protein